MAYKLSKGRITQEQYEERVAPIIQDRQARVEAAGGEAKYQELLSKAPRRYNEGRLQEYYGPGGPRGYYGYAKPQDTTKTYEDGLQVSVTSQRTQAIQQSQYLRSTRATGQTGLAPKRTPAYNYPSNAVASAVVDGQPGYLTIEPAPEQNFTPQGLNYTPASRYDLEYMESGSRPSEYAYNSAIGFSTEKGYTEILTPQRPNALIRGRIAYQEYRAKFKERGGAASAFNIFSKDSNFTKGVSFFGNIVEAQGYKLKQSSDSRAAQVVGGGLEILGTGYQQNPRTNLAIDVGTLGFGGLIGKGAGYVVKRQAAKKGVQAAIRTQRGLAVGGWGLTGAAVGTQYYLEGPESVVASTPRYLLGGIGYTSAYKSSLGKSSIAFLSAESTATIKPSRGSIRVTENFNGFARVTFAGRSEVVPYRGTVGFEGARLGPDYVGNVQGKATFGEGKGFMSRNFSLRGRYETRTGLFLTTSQGRPFTTTGGTSRALDFEGRISPTTGEYIKNPTPRSQYATTDATMIFSRGRVLEGYVFADGRGQQTVRNGFSVKRQVLASSENPFPPGEQPRAFNRTFNPRTYKASRRSARLGQYGGSLPRPSSMFDTVGQTQAVPRTSTLTRFGTLSAIGAAGSIPAFGALSLGFPTVRTRASGAVFSQTLAFPGAGATARATPATGAKAISLDISNPLAITGSGTGSSTRASSITTGTPITPLFPVTPITPPSTPGNPIIGFPGLPLFGGGTTGRRKGRGKRQGFRYAPSLTAGLFNIRGRQPKGPLTGFELRPLSI